MFSFFFGGLEEYLFPQSVSYLCMLLVTMKEGEELGEVLLEIVAIY